MKFFKGKIFSRILISFFIVALVSAAIIPNIVTAAEPHCVTPGSAGTLFIPDINFLACLNDVATWIGEFLLFIGGTFLWISGLLLNTVISYTILGMKELVENTEGINIAWRAFRDLANMSFIFIILYIAIMTILRLDTSETKRLLVHIIIVALLLNFSMFFTKVIIDISNTITIAFYDTLTGNLPTEGPVGLSDVFKSHVQLQGFYDVTGAKNILEGAKFALNMLLLGFLGMMLFITLAFIFLTVSILLISRFIVLVFLIILSPLAFASMALPKDEYSQKWWGALLAQVLWVPIFFALIWATLMVLDDLVPDTSGMAWTGLITEGGPNDAPNPSTIMLLLNFMIIIGLALFSLIAAKQVGDVGGNAIMGWGENTANWIGGGLRGSLARTAIRGFGAEWVGEKMREKGEHLRDHGESLWARGLGTGLRVTGMGTQALSLRKLHEKAQKTRAFQSWPLQAPMEATLGAIVNKDIHHLSAQEAHEQDEELANKRRGIRKLNASIKEERTRIENQRKLGQIESPEAKKEREEATKERLKWEKYIENKYYTKEMNLAKEEKQSAIDEMEALRKSLEDLKEEMSSGKGESESTATGVREPQSPQTPSADEIVSGNSMSMGQARREGEERKRRSQ